MGLEKSTHVTTSSNGRYVFRKSGDDLEIQHVDSGGVVVDSGTLSEADLRSLLKDNFKVTRGAKKQRAAPNGKTKNKGAEANA